MAKYTYFVKPQFLTEEFLFEDTPPAHIDVMPLVPAFPATTFKIAKIVPTITPDGERDALRSYLALDLPQLTMARELVQARINLLTPLVMLGIKVEDIYIKSPEGQVERVYNGGAVNFQFTKID